MAKRNCVSDLKERLQKQLEITRVGLLPGSPMHEGCKALTELIAIFMEYMEVKCDQKNLK